MNSQAPMMRHAERVRDARLLIGVTQEELSSASDVSQAAISMIERGERALSEEMASSFAKALSLPIEFFGTPPSVIPDSGIDFRKLKGASSKDTQRARVLFKEAFRVSTKLMRETKYPTPTLPVVQDHDFPLGGESIEDLATETRRFLQIDENAPISNVMRALERRGIAIAPLVVPSADEDVLALVQHFGASYWSSVHEHAVIGYFPGASGDRDRFTMGHELAHLVLHTFRQHVPVDIRESEANAFASAFLFPLNRAKEVLSPATKLRDLAGIKATWGVSMQAITMRGKNSGLIEVAHASSLFRQISARGWRKNEPVHVAHETPVLLRTLLERQYGANPFSASGIESEMSLPIGVLRSLAPSLSTVDQSIDRDNVRYVKFG